VECKIEGREEEIKERTIGAAVFGRPPDYDTPGDSIVRVRANEIRKRLAQYYQQLGASDPIRIDLHTGTYIPTFHWAGELARKQDSEAIVAPAQGPSPAAEKHSRLRLALLLVLGAAALVTAAVLWLAPRPETPLERFWHPFVASPKTVVIIIGGGPGTYLTDRMYRQLERIRAPDQEIQARRDDFAPVSEWLFSVPGIQAVACLTQSFARQGKDVQLRTGAQTRPEDLRDFSVISIGAFNNSWTRDKYPNLRFHFTVVPVAGVDWGHYHYSIRDRNKPGPGWHVTGVFPWVDQTIDYALITRVFEPGSDEAFVALAGISGFGTQVAGEFLSEPRYWSELAAGLPAGWEKKNLQIVLETRVIGTTPNPPRVAATHVWD